MTTSYNADLMVRIRDQDGHVTMLTARVGMVRVELKDETDPYPSLFAEDGFRIRPRDFGIELEAEYLRDIMIYRDPDESIRRVEQLLTGQEA